jgi:hypothetical protein
MRERSHLDHRMTDAEIAEFRASTTAVAAAGKAWAARKAAEFAALPFGTVVMIDIASGDYVTAADRLAAADRFHARFGRATTQGYSFEVGRPVFIGGGIA